jgi:hypothetical protein
MTDTTDALVGTVGGLLALGLVTNMAGRMMDNGHHHHHQHRRQRKPMFKKKGKIAKW